MEGIPKCFGGEEADILKNVEFNIQMEQQR